MPKNRSVLETFLNHPHHALFITIGVFLAAGLLATHRDLISARTLIARESDEQEESRRGSSSESNDNEDRDDEVQATPRPSETPKPSETPRPSATPEIEDEEETESELEIEEEIETEEELEIEIEEELPDQTQRLRIRTEDGRQRIDVTSGDVKIRLEERDGEVRVKAESDGEEFELEQEALEEVRERLEQTDLQLTASAGGTFRIERRGLPVRTNFPVLVDLATNQLSVETPTGEKIVAVLPDRAALALFNAGLTETEPDEFSALNPANEMELTQLETGELAYETITRDERRLLGVVPVRITTRVHLSAEDGQVLSAEGTTLFGRLLALLSQ